MYVLLVGKIKRLTKEGFILSHRVGGTIVDSYIERHAVEDDEHLTEGDAKIRVLLSYCRNEGIV